MTNWRNLKAHPAADLFPMLRDAEYAALRDNIRENGLLVPIVLLDGKILDGRNRYRACLELDLEPKFSEAPTMSPVRFAWSMNGARRDLTVSERAAIAAEMIPLLEAEAHARQVSGLKRGPDSPLASIDANGKKSAEIAAETVGVSPSSVERAVRVKRARPDLYQQIKSGSLSVSGAEKEVSAQAAAASIKLPAAVRADQIAAAAREGKTTAQISRELGIGEQRVRSVALAHGIKLAHHAIGKPRGFRVERVIDQTAVSLSGLAAGIRTVESELCGVSKEDAERWLDALAEPLREISKLTKILRRIATNEH